VLIVLYNFWVMFILYIRYKEFVTVRQHYLVRGAHWHGGDCIGSTKLQLASIDSSRA
jgi:hypothetical protein